MTTLASNPLDVARTRIMNEQVLEQTESGKVVQKHTMKYSTNPLRTIFCIARDEGLLALYKGFVPSYIRLGSVTTGFFVVYEQLRLLFGIAGV
jgi:solute carrier family 25 protein 14/30